MTQERKKPDFGQLFSSILEQPGIIGDYYSLFHRYSLSNQALAVEQMMMRGIEIGPISTFNGWKKLGRRVKKGEKALLLYMPITIRKKDGQDKDDANAELKDQTFTVFRLLPRWFAYAQTEPADDAHQEQPPSSAPDWDQDLALSKLGIRLIPYDHVDGNCQGYARPLEKEVAINPVAAHPLKTLFHEMAHCLLHGDEKSFYDASYLDRCIKEAEAESVAFLCSAALGLDSLDESRGYVQAWLKNESDRDLFLKKSARRVFACADKILKAGVPTAN